MEGAASDTDEDGDADDHEEATGGNLEATGGAQGGNLEAAGGPREPKSAGGEAAKVRDREMPHDENVATRNVLKKQRIMNGFVRHSNFDVKLAESRMAKNMLPV